MELSTKYDDIQSQIESDDADFALASDRVQTEDDLCSIECKLQHLLEQVEQVNQKPLLIPKLRLLKPPLYSWNRSNYLGFQVTLLSGNTILTYFLN